MGVAFKQWQEVEHPSLEVGIALGSDLVPRHGVEDGFAVAEQFELDGFSLLVY